MYPQFFKKPENANINSELPLSLEDSRRRILDAALWYLMRAQSDADIANSNTTEGRALVLGSEQIDALNRANQSKADLSHISGLKNDNIINLDDRRRRTAMADKARRAANESRQRIDGGNEDPRPPRLASEDPYDGIGSFEEHGNAG